MDLFDINEIRELFLNSCLVNGQLMPLQQIESMGWKEFSIRSKLNMPKRLYKYFSNLETKKGDDTVVNYSQQALLNNTVFLQTPTEFDDVYDSDITLDRGEYERLRLVEYCRRCGISVNDKATNQEAGDALVQALWPFYQSNGLIKAFVCTPEGELEKLANQAFCLTIQVKCQSAQSFGEAVSQAIADEYQQYVEYLKTIFRTACFATTPYSQLMWGAGYADQHRGFCVEYTVLSQDPAYQDVYLNLFPMIYCKTRPDVTTRIVKAKDKMYSDDVLWDIYFHGALRKSIDWAYQNEWRLLLPLGKNKADYNVKFFPITKVFLGNRMTETNRESIIDICKSKGIPYVGVTRNPLLFEMQDCEGQ